MWLPYSVLNKIQMFTKEGVKDRKQNPHDNDKIPHVLLENFWTLCTPFLYGTIGASIEFNKISPDVLLYGFIVVTVSLFFRLVATFFATNTNYPVFNIKERLFISVS